MIFTQFQGELPLISEVDKPDSVASVAENVTLGNGIAPYGFAITSNVNLSNLDESVIRIDGQIYTMPKGFVARSPLANDARGRIYYTRDVPYNGKTAFVIYSKGTDGSLLGANSVVRPLGVPLGSTPNVTATMPTLDPPANEVPVVTYYAVTLVNQWGEEGALSNPSIQVTLYSNSTLVINRPPEALDADIAKWNIYMANNGQWQFMTSVDKATPSVTLNGDDAKYPALGEVCPSIDWLEPPSDLKGLTAMSGGFLAGYSGRTVYFSEPYLPHAWSAAYQYSVQYDILGIVSINNGLVVITTGRPYLILGAQPSTMQIQQLEIDAGCVSQDSIVDMGDFAMYASTIGLIRLGASGASIASDHAWPKHRWSEINPSTMKALRFKQYYVFETSAATYSWLLDTETGNVSRSDTLDIPTFNRGFYDPTDDQTYVIQNTGGTKKRLTIKLDKTTTNIWKSKTFQLTGGLSPSFGRIDADAYPVKLVTERSHDGVTFVSNTYTVTDRKPFRLSAGRYMFMRFALRNITGTVSRVVLTNDRAEVN